MNRFLTDWSAHMYHHEEFGRDDLPPMLSASTAKRLLLRSPLHAWTHHPKLGGVREETTDAMDGGTLIHAIMLGHGPEIVTVEAKDWRTTAAKEARESAEAAGRLAVLAHKLTRAQNTAKILTSRIEALGFRLDGDNEITALWETDGVQCRGRFDHLCSDDRTILDLKTSDSAHPDAIRRSIENFGADIQASAYVQALETIRPELAGAVRFLFVYVETVEPYAVTVVERAGSMRELGDRRWRRAVAIWKRCLAAGKWPGYSDAVVQVEASDWAMARETEAQLDAMGTNPSEEF